MSAQDNITSNAVRGPASGIVRDRVKELRRVPAGDLLPNPKNWREHPQAQRDALRGVLAEVGYADALIARETDDGRLMLIDGHLRAETTPDQEVPVLVLDVDEAESDKILATFDPLSAMAEANAEQLELLHREIRTGSQALTDMLGELTEESRQFALRDAEAGGAVSTDRQLKDRSAQIKSGVIRAVLGVQNVDAFESALRATGLDSRSEAILFICKFYTEHHGKERQSDIAAKGVSATEGAARD